jgi:BirA family transcriptional regulator, biotin operon repressor / biotin---[acetyl-CoA-carboxylase] ligase
VTSIVRDDAGHWPFVKTMVVLDEVDSTNDRAAELVRAGGVSLPCCVWAARQTRGRGRGDHSWWSDSGSLTFTLAIDPAAHGLAPASEPKLALATAVAVIDALVALDFDSPALGIRWPNDVEIDGRKLGGILPEQVETEEGHRILIGVGINVSTDMAAAPAEIRRMATSLSAIPGAPLDAATLPRLLAAILEHFSTVMSRLARSDASLFERWKALDLLRDAWLTVDLGNRIAAGRGRGIDEDGALCLDQGGAILRLFGGRVLR